jgi:two-component system, NtrC family, sensor kinase
MSPVNSPEGIQQHIDRLNDEAWEVRVSDSNKAFSLSSEVVALARQVAYKKGLAYALRTQGFGLIRLSKHKEAMLALDEAFDLFAVLGEEKETSPIYEYYGIIHRSFGNFDASLEALYKALDICEGTAYHEETSLVYYHLGATYKYMGNYEKALHYLLQSLTIAREITYWVAESYALNLIGQVYLETGDFQQALMYYQQSLQIRKTSGDLWGEAGCLDNIGYTYYKLSLLEKAVQHCTESLAICRKNGDQKGQANTLFHLSEVYLQQGNVEKALSTANESLKIRKDISDKKGQAEVLLLLAELSLFRKADSVVHFLKEALEIANEVKAQDLLAKVHFHFYTAYKSRGDYENALQILETFNGMERELHKDALAEKIINLQITHNIEQAKQEAENYRLRNAELAALYQELKKQKEETDAQKQKAEESLQQLKETQAQLIQREKMASLGELTAGVAHEIQNPLNFINNFSEVNLELIEELKVELKAAKLADALVLSADMEHNLQKIVDHGKRADSIVKNMVRHSARNSGHKEITDINVLADEYLRLSYHGMRTRDSTFSACIRTSFDEKIGAISISPQDIGRVLLNVYNNAFYAVAEKRKQQNNSYEPTISIKTQQTNNLVEISIRDNGTGITQDIREKIFHPFFTTKPTGEGTGLGLSLSYDIIKAHGGEIKVETK